MHVFSNTIKKYIRSHYVVRSGTWDEILPKDR